ncbi:hypothetical protein [Streptomyces luteocolor]|uniref:hypothetical protein n=1 Tax=Streptomyces luteocolor TaxID=285500 RepID=UPI00114D3912|nr:hypothetical protein [Streptomyces luteocolor]
MTNRRQQQAPARGRATAADTAPQRRTVGTGLVAVGFGATSPAAALLVQQAGSPAWLLITMVIGAPVSASLVAAVAYMLVRRTDAAVRVYEEAAGAVRDSVVETAQLSTLETLQQITSQGGQFVLTRSADGSVKIECTATSQEN